MSARRGDRRQDRGSGARASRAGARGTPSSRSTGRAPHGRTPVPPVPLERPRATALLTGLMVFALGFAVAGVLVLADRGRSPAYFIAVTIGFLGIGIVGLFLNRGTVPLPEGPIWSRVGLQALGRALQVPAVLLMVVFYGLVAFGVLANFVVPVFVR